MTSLRSHMNKEHAGIQLCGLCIDFKKVFPSEHTCYSSSDYERHLKLGDGDGSEGHPKCQFCVRRFYDKNMLITHLEKDHYSCHLCVKNGIKFKYFKNYECLEHHFRQMHFLCEERSCLEKKFVVFGNNIDYVAHMHSWHPTLQVSRSIPMSFKSYEKESIEKEAEKSDTESFIGSSSMKYDGGVAGRDINGEWQVLMPQGARDPREGRRLREGSQSVDDEEYPSEHTFVPAEYPTLQGDIKDDSKKSEAEIKWRKSESTEDYPALVGAERKAPLGQARIANWGARIKVNKKLTVRKPSTVKRVANSENVAHSGPFAYSLQQQIDRQLRNGKSAASNKSFTDTTNVKNGASLFAASTSNKLEGDSVRKNESDELTLAEKIKIEQMIKEDKEKAMKMKKKSKELSSADTTNTAKISRPPVPPGVGLFAPPPAPKSNPNVSTQSSAKSAPAVKSSLKASSEAPTKKTGVSKNSNSSVVSGWGAALSADGLEVKKKKVAKKSSGLTVVKKTSSQKIEVTEDNSCITAVPPPPPGFDGPPPGLNMPSQSISKLNVTDSDFPSFPQTSTQQNIHKKEIAAEKPKQEKWQKVTASKGNNNVKIVKNNNNKDSGSSSSQNKFPGTWAPSIGGSGGKKSAKPIENNSALSDMDFPDFSSTLGADTSKPSSRKPKKSTKCNFIKIS